ncbi:MAG: hypothetical protein ACI3V3_01160 [Faecousia sp.]
MKKRGFSTKAFVLVLALVLALGCVIGGTIAWLTAQTAPVVNTFTVGDINITLAETKTDFKMVPGNTIEKDPKVTVKADSEACWLFVKIEESTNLDDFISYSVATGWTPLTGVDGVYYREVAATTADTSFDVLTNNQVTVKDTVTKEMMNAFDTDKDGVLSDAEKAALPTLTFTAYAVQMDNVTSATEAWAKVNP